MKKLNSHILGVALLALAAGTACGTSQAAPAQPSPGPAPGGYPHTEADVHFITGMIPHHAQAVKIARWAASRSADAGVKVLAERIVVAQLDEIGLMRTWLADRGLPVPAADATHMRMMHNGQPHDMLMPGMLTDEELAALERARGTEFDRLFLTSMIRHHEGAVKMVDELHESPGAAQEEFVFRLSSDIYADQTTEIDRMQKMLAALPRQ